MPSIDLPDEVFARIKLLAIPFVDTTPVSVIERALSSLEGNAQDPAGRQACGPRTFGPADAPNLTDTRILSAKFGEQVIETPFWNSFLRAIHEKAFANVGSVPALKRLTVANIEDGAVSDRGYMPIVGGGFSIQGVDANSAWRIAYHLARKLEFPIYVEFEWRPTSKAEHPSESAILSWRP